MKNSNNDSLTRESPSGASPCGNAALKKPAKTFKFVAPKHNVMSAFELQALAEMERLDNDPTPEQMDELFAALEWRKIK
tara:strand:+ start:614 stop:850 length:237 start_codon:yes stop_codon:yes gene_type:complete